MLRGESSELYEDGRYYDCLFTTDGERPAAFWIEQAREAGGPVLELACGTGAIAIPLARAGCDVTGLDLSEPMLSEARRKAGAADVAVDWRQGDIRDFQLERKYSLIILASNVLCHLVDLPSLEACLGCVCEHLAEDGRFVLSVFVPNPELLRRRCDEPRALAEYDDPDGRGPVVVTETYEYHADTQVKHIKLHRRLGTTEQTGTLTMRMYFPAELMALLHYNGFEVMERWEDHERRPFGPDSGLQVLVCRVPPAADGDTT